MVDVISEFDKDTWNVAASFRVNKELHTHTEPTPQNMLSCESSQKFHWWLTPLKYFLIRLYGNQNMPKPISRLKM